jgi:hypothetical protein
MLSASIIALVLEAVGNLNNFLTSETSVSFYQTARCSIPEDIFLSEGILINETLVSNWNLVTSSS